MGRPWYVQAADVAHRLTVLGIIGFTATLIGGTIVVNTIGAYKPTQQKKPVITGEELKSEQNFSSEPEKK